MLDLPLLASLGLVVGVGFCALRTITARRLLHAALWLAGTSALTSLLLYRLGAQQAAVIELSVGAGLVFILFIFTINLAGEAGPTQGAAVLRALAAVLVGLAGLLLVELAWPRLPDVIATPAGPLTISLWVDRQFDVVAQLVMIFAGAITIVGLLAGTAAPDPAPKPERP